MGGAVQKTVAMIPRCFTRSTGVMPTTVDKSSSDSQFPLPNQPRAGQPPVDNLVAILWIACAEK